MEEEHKNNLKYIFGRKIKDQARLLRAARKETNKWRQIKLDDIHYSYLSNFFKKNSLLILGLLALLFASGIIETTLLISSRNQLAGASRDFITNYLWWFFGIFIIIFLVNSYFSIKYERSLVVILANDIRRRLYQDYIERSIDSASFEKQANLIAKISYQLPLVSMGVSNTFFGLWRWFIYLMIVFVISLIGSFNLFITLSGFIAISVILFLVSYFVARFYISQEVTFYSRIIKEVDFNTSDIKFLKTFSQEGAALNRFDKLVWFDSFFRVKRDILLRIGFKIVFALLIVISIWSHFFSKDFYSIIGLSGGLDKLFFLFLIIYFSRALTEAVKMGLYLFPARLGLFLTIMPPSRQLIKGQDFNIKDKTISFYSYKSKFFAEGPYYRDWRFDFSPSDRIIFCGNNLSGKTSLAKLFAGLGAYNHLAVKVVINKERFDYSAWQKMCTQSFFFDPSFRTDRSLMEYIIGKSSDMMNMSEFEEALKIINEFPQIVDLVAKDGNYNICAKEVLSNPVRAFALQSLHCLINNYQFIIIDNFWLDLNYDAISDMIKVLDKILPKSIMVIFSKNRNDILSYDKEYFLDQKIILK